MIVTRSGQIGPLWFQIRVGQILTTLARPTFLLEAMYLYLRLAVVLIVGVSFCGRPSLVMSMLVETGGAHGGTPLQGDNCSIKTSPATIDQEFDKLFTRNGPGWTGGDSTYSIKLPNGDSVFFFSDSYIADNPPTKNDGTVTTNENGLRKRQENCYTPTCDPPSSLFNARNSLVVRDHLTGEFRTLSGPKDAEGWRSYFQLPPGSDKTHYLWVGDSIVINSRVRGDLKLWVFLMEFDPKLAYHGTYIAQLTIPSLKIESLTKVTGTEGSTVAWGGSLLLERSGNYPTLYIYGLQNKQTINGKVPYLAKVNPAQGVKAVSDAANWLIWTGQSWEKGWDKASQLIGAPDDRNNAKDQISDEVDVNKLRVNGRDVYVFVGLDTTVPFGLWKHITIYSACRPEGPWSAKQVVYTIPEAESRRVPGMTGSQLLDGPMVIYNPHLHSQFTNENGVLISYNNNTSKGQDLMFADTYRPHFVRVKIAGLQPTK
jgi:hypothetical protein